VLADGRRARLIGLGGPVTAPLLSRIAEQMADAAAAVTAFWGPGWPREITVVASATDEQFHSLVGFGPDTAAATTDERIVFAPGATSMNPAALRIVLRHELFHYAARSVTAADAPRWLTEGVADFVARPAGPPPAPHSTLTQLPTDAALEAVGPERSLGYDQAWWFTRYVADRYGTPALRALYLRACGPGHPDVATAVRETLGAGLPEVLDGWRHWRALA